MKNKNSDAGGFKNLINSMTGKVKQSGPKIKDGDRLLSNDKAAESFGKFFYEKIEGLCGNFKDENVSLNPDDKQVIISADILDKAVKKSKSKKSCGTDCITMIILKDVYSSYKFEVLHLFNRIL